jgi:hypothetical protein
MLRHISIACIALLVCFGIGRLVTPAAAQKPDQEKKTVEGELVDMHCFTTGAASGEKHKGCGSKCASSGIPVGITADGKAYTLLTNPKPLAQYMASMVRVTGELNKDTMTVAPDKVEVQQGGKWQEVKLDDAHHGAGAEK